TEWLVWAAWATTLAMIVPTLAFESINVGADPLASNLLGALAFLAYITIGALVALRRSDNPIGWLLVGAALVSAFGNLALEYAVYGLITRPGSLPGGALLGVLGGVARSVGFVIIGTILLLLFPTGHLPLPRWRPLALIALALIALFALSILLG